MNKWFWNDPSKFDCFGLSLLFLFVLFDFNLFDKSEELDMGLLQDTHPDRTFYQLFSEPSDYGFNGVARTRTWCMGCHSDRSTILHDPYELHDTIRKTCGLKHHTGIPDLVASRSEILLEAQHLSQWSVQQTRSVLLNYWGTQCTSILHL